MNDAAALERRLRAVFRAEAAERLEEARAAVTHLAADAGDGDALGVLRRVLHTLKGAAGAVGADDVARLVHTLEEQVERGTASDPSLAARFGAALDALALAIETATAASPPEPTPAPPAAPDAPADRSSARTPLRTPPDVATVAAPFVRVEHDALLAITADLGAVQAQLDALLAAEEARASAAPRAGPSDDDDRRVQVAAHGAAAALRAVRAQVAALRFVPLATIEAELDRAVRDAAGRAGRAATLTVDVGDVRVERAVLDALRDALLHLVRNAVDHGIEPAAERARRGKPPVGRITVHATRDVHRVRVTCRDDGQGLDVQRLRARLAELGEVVPADSDAVIERVLAGGVSSRADAPTLLSGRGVGLATVRHALRRVGGTAAVSSAPGQGVTATLEAPVGDVPLPLLSLEAAGTMLMVPVGDVATVVRRASIALTAGGTVASVDGDPVPLVAPGGAPRPRADGEAPHLLVLRAQARRAAVACTVRGVVHATVQPLPLAARRRHAALAGAACTMEHGAALVLDATALVAQAHAGVAAADSTAAPTASTPAPRHLLLADDALTTRTMLEGVLRAAGYQVTTARDGAEAWRLLQSAAVDAVVSDVEMPAMDGLALVRAIRASRSHALLPVVLVTGLESDADRAAALAAGADAHLGKATFHHDELLRTIERLLASRARAPGGSGA